MLFVLYVLVECFDDICMLMDDYQCGLVEVGIVDMCGMVVVVLYMYVGLIEVVVCVMVVDVFDLYVVMWFYVCCQMYDDVLVSGLLLFGMFDVVVEKFVWLFDMGVDYVMVLYNFGLML